MKNLLLFYAIVNINICFSQKTISVEVTPNIVYSSIKGSGNIPQGFFINRANPSINFGVSIAQTFHKHFSVILGFNYFMNRYKSKFYTDYEKNKIPFFRDFLQTSFFEPKLLFRCSYDFNAKNRLFIETGLGLSISKSPSFSINQIYLTNSDTIYSKINVTPLNNASYLKLYFSIGKTFYNTQKLNGELLFTYRHSANEEVINRTLIRGVDSYNFSYFRNSSYLGITLKVNYSFIKKT
jgi:hypothetical protein